MSKAAKAQTPQPATPRSTPDQLLEHELVLLFRRLPELDQNALLQQAREWAEIHQRQNKRKR